MRRYEKQLIWMSLIREELRRRIDTHIEEKEFETAYTLVRNSFKICRVTAGQLDIEEFRTYLQRQKIYLESQLSDSR